MKQLLSIFLLVISFPVAAAECQAPGQGFLEGKVKEVFHGPLGESELKEWVNHSSNSETRQEIKAIDRRSKFIESRWKREELVVESQTKFEQIVQNVNRPSEYDHFPAANAHSKVSASANALTIEMSNLNKEELDLFPKAILDKLDSRIKINYYYPYEKFEYLLTYDGQEMPMQKALNKVQTDMERNCEENKIDNHEYKTWYTKHHKSRWGGSGTGASGQ